MLTHSQLHLTCPKCHHERSFAFVETTGVPPPLLPPPTPPAKAGLPPPLPSPPPPPQQQWHYEAWHVDSYGWHDDDDDGDKRSRSPAPKRRPQPKAKAGPAEPPPPRPARPDFAATLADLEATARKAMRQTEASGKGVGGSNASSASVEIRKGSKGSMGSGEGGEGGIAAKGFMGKGRPSGNVRRFFKGGGKMGKRIGKCIGGVFHYQFGEISSPEVFSDHSSDWSDS